MSTYLADETATALLCSDAGHAFLFQRGEVSAIQVGHVLAGASL